MRKYEVNPAVLRLFAITMLGGIAFMMVVLLVRGCDEQQPVKKPDIGKAKVIVQKNVHDSVRHAQLMADKDLQIMNLTAELSHYKKKVSSLSNRVNKLSVVVQRSAANILQDTVWDHCDSLAIASMVMGETIAEQQQLSDSMIAGYEEREQVRAEMIEEKDRVIDGQRMDLRNMAGVVDESDKYIKRLQKDLKRSVRTSKVKDVAIVVVITALAAKILIK